MYSFIKILISTIVVLLILIAGFILFSKNKDGINLFQKEISSKKEDKFLAPEGIPNTHLESSPNSGVVVPLSLLNESRAAFFTYPVIQGKKIHTIRFFVVKDINTYRAVLDACLTCYTFNKGYDYEAPFFRCRHCGMEFHWKRVGVSRGNCNPIKIGSLQEGEFLLISREDLENSVQFFSEGYSKE